MVPRRLSLPNDTTDYDQLFKPSSPSAPQPAPSSGGQDYDAMFAPNSGGPPSTYTMGQRLGAGFIRGAEKGIYWPVEGLAKGTDWLGLTQGKGQEMADLEQQRQGTYQQNYGNDPIANLANLAGQVVSTAPLIGMGGKALGALADYAGVTTAAKSLPSVVQKLGAPALTGATQGIAGTALTSGPEGPDTNPFDLAVTGGVGAGAGLIGAGVGKAAGAIGNYLTSGTPTGIRNTVARTLTESGISPAQAIAKMRQMGPDATLTDVLGVKQAAKLGLDQDAAQKLFSLRHFGNEETPSQIDRIGDIIKRTTGTNANYLETEDKLFADRTANAGPLFERAFQAPVPNSAFQALKPILMSPKGQQGLEIGLRQAQDAALVQGVPFNPADYGLVQDASGRWNWLNAGPNLRLMHAVKEGLDDIVEKSRAQNNGRLDKDGYLAAGIAKRFRDTLRDAVPEYGQALDAWAGPSASREALEMGKNALRTDYEVTARDVQNLTPSQKDFYKIGLSKAMADQISGSDSSDKVKALFGSQKLRQRIQAAFDDPKSFSEFRDAMRGEAAMAQSNRDIGSGAAQGQLSVNPLQLVRPVISAMHGNYHGAALHLLGSMMDQGNAAPNAAVNRLLLTPDVNYVEKALLGKPSIGEIAGAAGRGAGRAVLHALPQASTISLPRPDQTGPT